eukprot:TRINITY_DN15969_c0_g1_i1.p3 TRINITY_DN15969_c0_g1~~TRINITY_DN15969_c0_g1_i1.p3  ORF type:complete len:211 (-),score=42.09 TRINITY_DN15969_c0_g1_i1:78-710(-)
MLTGLVRRTAPVFLPLSCATRSLTTAATHSTTRKEPSAKDAYSRELELMRRELRLTRQRLQSEVREKLATAAQREQEAHARIMHDKQARVAAAQSAKQSASQLDPTVARAAEALATRKTAELQAKAQQELQVKAQRRAEWEKNASLMRRMYLREARRLLGKPIPSITTDTLKQFSDPDELEKYLNSFSGAHPTTSQNIGENDFWEAEASK